MYQSIKFGMIGITVLSTNVVDNILLDGSTDKMMQ
jgi:hypothetical protein